MRSASSTGVGGSSSSSPRALRISSASSAGLSCGACTAFRFFGCSPSACELCRHGLAQDTVCNHAASTTAS